VCIRTVALGKLLTPL